MAALVLWPAMPLGWAIVATGLIGFGVGTVFPIATVSIQNAVARHEVGTATGAMNFFRALASALVVAIMGAILLAGLGVTPERGGVGIELMAAAAAPPASTWPMCSAGCSWRRWCSRCSRWSRCCCWRSARCADPRQRPVGGAARAGRIGTPQILVRYRVVNETGGSAPSKEADPPA